MTEEIWAPEWIEQNPELANKAITTLQEKVQELESKLRYMIEKAAKLESQNREFKQTIKNMDRRILKGLK
jgi:uncharacterized coiled-coil protein SlyX